MDIKDLYKDACNFERQVLNTGTPNDSLSDIDIAILEDKLNTQTKRAMKKLASMFSGKLQNNL